MVLKKAENPASNVDTANAFGTGRIILSSKKSNSKLGDDQRLAQLELDNEELRKDIEFLKSQNSKKGFEINKLKGRVFRT